jgi:hypothetical protein
MMEEMVKIEDDLRSETRSSWIHLILNIKMYNQEANG